MADPDSPALSLDALVARESALRSIDRALCINVGWPLPTPPATLIEARTDAQGLLSLERDLRVDLALIRIDPPHDASAGVDATLAQLRDLHAARVLAIVPADAATALRDHMRSLGLDSHAQVTIDGRAMYAFRFDAMCTKPTPTWLNADHWANPERWNRARW